MEVPVYAFAGFLESGKTSFMKETLGDPNFTEDERTLVLLCEEGEEEFDTELLQRTNAILVTIESQEELNPAHLMTLAAQYQPDRVLLEWNGMWPIAELGVCLPQDWNVYQIVTIINSQTFELYSANMGTRMLEQIANAELVVLNRANEAIRETLRARNLQAMNPRATFYFDNEDGTAEEYMDSSELPFDLDAPVIEISDENYGVWYIDAMQSPEKYVGKTVKVTGMVYKGKDFAPDTFVPGRFGMVCCADDITFIGFLCQSEEAAKYQQEDWVTVTATIQTAYYAQFRGDAPVLYATHIEPAQKADPELVYFN